MAILITQTLITLLVIGELLMMLVNVQNVASAIDTLVTTINDLIAPTNEDYNIAADRLYFNRKYIAEEIVGRNNANQRGLLGQELRYTNNKWYFYCNQL